MSYDDDLPSSEPTMVMPAVPVDGAPPPQLPPSPPGPVFPNGGPLEPDPNRTPKIIALVSAALIVLFAIIFAVTRDSDDEIATTDSTLPLTIASSSLPPTTLPASTLPGTTAPPSTAPATVATTAPTTTAAPTTTVAPTTTLAPTTTAAPTTTRAPATTTTTVPVPLCASDDLAIDLGDQDVTPDATVTEVYVRNIGGSTCILDAPGVMRFVVGGAPVGAEITATSSTDLQLSTVGSATAVWRMSTADSLGCTPSDPPTIELVFGAAILTGPATEPVCTDESVEQGELQGFEPGRLDLVPG